MNHDIQLSPDEAQMLKSCEAAIEIGQKTFIDVGRALTTIRDQKLYRATHDTFEAYCRERWNFVRNHANKQIAAAAFVARLGTGVPKPMNEAQVRPLLRFPPDVQPQVWETVAKHLLADGKPQLTASVYKISEAIDFEVVIAKEGPFKDRRIAIKNEKRKKRELLLSNTKQPAPLHFDLPSELRTLQQTVLDTRRSWPAEHLQDLAETLHKMAVQILTPCACQKCGAYELDADGDCARCELLPSAETAGEQTEYSKEQIDRNEETPKRDDIPAVFTSALDGFPKPHTEARTSKVKHEEKQEKETTVRETVDHQPCRNDNGRILGLPDILAT